MTNNRSNNNKFPLPTSKSWRKFEKVVQLIEYALAPKGAIVTSPDRIADKVTGELREVDVSIKMDVGSSEILIAVECRERSRKQDVQWIEQIAEKQRSIGANKMIAVTSKGISEQAMKKAQFYGISVRKLENITNDSIFRWLEVDFRHYVHINYGFVTDSPSTKVFERSKPIEKLTVFDVNGKEVRADDVIYNNWDYLIKNNKVPLHNRSGKKIQEYKLASYVPKGQYFFESVDGLFEWIGIIYHFSLEVTKQQIESDVFIYSSESDLISSAFIYEEPYIERKHTFHHHEGLGLKDGSGFLIEI